MGKKRFAKTRSKQTNPISPEIHTLGSRWAKLNRTSADQLQSMKPGIMALQMKAEQPEANSHTLLAVAKDWA